MKKVIFALILVLYANFGGTNVIASNTPQKHSAIEIASKNIVFIHSYESYFFKRTIYVKSNTSDGNESRLIESIKDAIAQNK